MKYSSSTEREAAFNQLWQDHQGIVVRMARYYASPQAGLDDLTQEIAVQLWRSFENFKGESRLSTWVYRVALNTCLALHRRKQPHQVEMKELPDLHPASQPEIQLDQQELLRAIRAFATQFKPVDQSLLLLLMEGVSYEEMATITGLSETNVGARINRIRKRLKAAFA